MYLIFTAQPELPVPAGQALDPADKIALHATGQYEVEGKSHFFADLLAYWRTFATREHAVMAIVHESRYLLFGTMPESDIGMWYIFFKPRDIRSVAAGQLTYGAQHRPALAVSYLGPPGPSPSGLRRLFSKAPTREKMTAYLVFDDEAGRACVWADLLADGPWPAAD
jgi:hypothetical protein